MRQYLANNTASGRSETDATAEFTDAPVTYDIETEEANKRIVASFLNLGFNAGQYDTALGLYADPNYAQHNPGFADGAQPILYAVAAGQMPSFCYDLKFVLAQNDLGWTYSRVTTNGQVLAIVDMFRVRDGVIVEHWDTIQAVPDAADMPHDNTMF